MGLAVDRGWGIPDALPPRLAPGALTREGQARPIRSRVGNPALPVTDAGYHGVAVP
jgi:hypothetical protein